MPSAKRRVAGVAGTMRAAAVLVAGEDGCLLRLSLLLLLLLRTGPWGSLNEGRA